MDCAFKWQGTEFPRHHDALKALPQTQGEGCIYLVAFQTGIIKAGRTTDPAARIQTHAALGRSMGAPVTLVWVSSGVSNYIERERDLISWCRANCTASSGSEYFVGLDIDMAISFVGELPDDGFPAPSPSNPGDNKHFTLSEVAEMTGISLRWIQEQVRGRAVTHARSGRKPLMSRKHIQALVDRAAVDPV